MTFQKQILSTCPACGHSALRIIEHRKINTAIRRRKQCNVCSHRVTTYEVTKEAFRDAQNNAAMLSRLLKILITRPDPETEPPCAACKFNEESRCSFGLPEYFTKEAAGCNLFE